MNDNAAFDEDADRRTDEDGTASASAAHEAIEGLLERIQELEDLVEELTEVALVNRAAMLVLLKKEVITRDELKKVWERIEVAHAEARESDGAYRILPAAAAYFLEEE